MGGRKGGSFQPLHTYKVDVADWAGWTIRWTKQGEDIVNLLPGKCQCMMEWHENTISKPKREPGGKMLKPITSTCAIVSVFKLIRSMLNERNKPPPKKGQEKQNQWFPLVLVASDDASGRLVVPRFPYDYIHRRNSLKRHERKGGGKERRILSWEFSSGNTRNASVGVACWSVT